MTFPEIAPYDSGHLQVDDGAQIYWETSGDPSGTPVLWLHGGPGSGLGRGGYRQRLDPKEWRIIGLDQRACGRSTPAVTDPGFDLAKLTTQRMVEDLEQLRAHLGVERWLVSGGSWGSTLALAYAEAHPHRVTSLVLIAVTTTSREEVDWITEHVGRIFPREWEEFAAASGHRAGERVVDAYLRRLTDSDGAVQAAAAAAWCSWEDVHVSLAAGIVVPTLSNADPSEQLPFARHVVNSWSNSAFLGDDGIMDDLERIAHIPAVLIHGRLDVSGPLVTPWRLYQRWPASRLVVVDDEGHGGSQMAEELERAYARLAGAPRTGWPSSSE